MENNNNEEKPLTQNQRQHFLAFYIIALFSVALVLVFLSYITQVKADRQLETINSQLNEQVSQVQGAKARAEALQATLENQSVQIKEKEATITKYNKALNIENESMLDSAINQYENKEKALDYLWKLEKNFQLKKYNVAVQILDQMENDFPAEMLSDSKSGILNNYALQEYLSIKMQLDIITNAQDTKEGN